MNALIVDAIQNRKRLSFTYHGEHREVDPYAYGRDRNGHDSLRAFQVNTGWRMFHLSDVQGLSVGEVSPSPVHSEYRRNDRHMTHIYAQV